MTDQELLARIRQTLDILEHTLSDNETPGDIKAFVHHALSLSFHSLQGYSMFERTLWTAHHIVKLKNDEMATAMPRAIVVEKNGGAL